MSAISGVLNVRKQALTPEVINQSKTMVFEQLNAILTQLKGSTNREAIAGLEKKAISVYEFYKQNIALNDHPTSLSRIGSLFSQIQKVVGEAQSPVIVRSEAVQGRQGSISTPRMSAFQTNLAVLISILKNHLDSQGLFRLSGQTQVLNAIDPKTLTETRIKQVTDIDTLAGLLKRVLRTEPLLQPIKTELLNLAANACPSTLKAVVEALSLESQQTLKMLFGFLAEVANNADTNKMLPANLAICFVPNLFSEPKSIEEQVIQMTETPQLNTIFMTMLAHHDQIFN